MIDVTVKIPRHHEFGTLQVRALLNGIQETIATALGCGKTSVMGSVNLYEYATEEGVMITILITNRAPQFTHLEEQLRAFFTKQPYPTEQRTNFTPVTCLIVDAQTGRSQPVSIRQP